MVMSRSIFAKMNILMRQCAATPGLPIDDLATQVRDQALDEFKVFKRVDELVTEDYCQVATIRRTLYLLADLGLMVVDPACSLTETGEAALEDYARGLGSAVADYLQSAYGLALSSIRKAISDIKTRQASTVPSAEHIYNELRVQRAFRQPIAVSRFVTLLNLLGHCGVVHWYIKKYYWA
jgi:Fe2+ or Zn2+ uptake regulation protein